MPTIPDFIARWEHSKAAERANYQLFLSELCDALDVERPRPSENDDERDVYVFEKKVPTPGEEGVTLKRIDLYKKGHFIRAQEVRSAASFGEFSIDHPPSVLPARSPCQIRRARRRCGRPPTRLRADLRLYRAAASSANGCGSGSDRSGECRAVHNR